MDMRNAFNSRGADRDNRVAEQASADQDHLYPGIVHQRQGNARAVGHRRERQIRRQAAHQLGGGGSAVDNHHLAGRDQFDALLRHPLFRLDAQMAPLGKAGDRL